MLWDVQVGKNLGEFNGHEGDVVTLSVNAGATHFVTGSVDRTAKLWDVRTPGWSAQQTFWGHESDVNSVCVSVARHGAAAVVSSVSTRDRVVFYQLVWSSEYSGETV